MYIILVALIGLLFILAGVASCLDDRRRRRRHAVATNKALYNRANSALAKMHRDREDAIWRSRGTWN